MLGNRTIIQIGSHIGNTINDPIFKHIDKSTKLFLVEPVPYLYSKLIENYSNKLVDISNIVFINKAISDRDGQLTLNIPSLKNDFSKLPFWATQISSVNYSHLSMHIPSLIIDKIDVECITLDSLVSKYNIANIYLLHIDTEGHDYDILMAYSFSIKPTIVIFEHKHMDGFVTTGKRYSELVDRLNGFGYKLVVKGGDDSIFRLGS